MNEIMHKNRTAKVKNPQSYLLDNFPEAIQALAMRAKKDLLAPSEFRFHLGHSFKLLTLAN